MMPLTDDERMALIMSRAVEAAKLVRDTETRKAMPIIKALLLFDAGMLLMAGMLTSMAITISALGIISGIAIFAWTNSDFHAYYLRNALRDAGYSEVEISAARVLLRRHRL